MRGSIKYEVKLYALRIILYMETIHMETIHRPSVPGANTKYRLIRLNDRTY